MRSGREAIATKLAALQASAEQESAIISTPLEHGLVFITFLVFAVSTVVLAAFWKMVAPDVESKGPLLGRPAAGADWPRMGAALGLGLEPATAGAAWRRCGFDRAERRLAFHPHHRRRPRRRAPS